MAPRTPAGWRQCAFRVCAVACLPARALECAGLLCVVARSEHVTCAAAPPGLGQWCAMVAFHLYPTGMDQLFDVADADMLMPPKSTWFEPKLRGGVVLHDIK